VGQSFPVIFSEVFPFVIRQFAGIYYRQITPLFLDRLMGVVYNYAIIYTAKQ